MSDQKALLREVIESPDDDAPRLVMSDWFEENGEPDRAEFIRLQIELAREDVAAAEEPVPRLTRMSCHRVSYGDPGRERRLERMIALYRARHREWKLEVAAGARPAVDFCRGFIACLDAPPRQWLKGAARLHRAAPVTDLCLRDAGGSIREVAACPHLARISALALKGPFASAEEAAALAGSPHLERRLRSLSLIGARPAGWLGDAVRAACWPGLRCFELQYCELDDAIAVALAANPAFASLLQLSLWSGVGPAGAEALAGSPHAGRLEYLCVGNNPIGDAGALALVRSSRRLPALTRLEMWRCGVTAAGAEALAAEPGLARLRHLDLSESQLGDAGAAALAASPHLAGLRRLGLARCNITDAGVMALAGSPHLSGLREMRLGDNPIGAAALARLRDRFETVHGP